MNTEENPYDFSDDFLKDGGSKRIATFVPSKKGKSFINTLPSKFQVSRAPV